MAVEFINAFSSSAGFTLLSWSASVWPRLLDVTIANMRLTQPCESISHLVPVDIGLHAACLDLLEVRVTSILALLLRVLV
jgi:hypothetical protein